MGKSGGTGIIVKALERLPEGSGRGGDGPSCAKKAAAAALSPEYDLTRALAAVRTEVVVFWSPLDLIVLGLGTRIFGTIDRARSVSAGLVGFRPPKSADPAAYARLRQVRWNVGMAPTMYWGGHVGPDSPWFIRRYVLPLLRQSGAESDPASSPARAAPIT